MTDTVLTKMRRIRDQLDERQAASYIMHAVDALILEARFDEADKFLSPDIDYTLRERLTILTITLPLHADLPSRPDFFRHSYNLIAHERPDDVEALFQGLERMGG